MGLSQPYLMGILGSMFVMLQMELAVGRASTWPALSQIGLGNMAL